MTCYQTGSLSFAWLPLAKHDHLLKDHHKTIVLFHHECFMSMWRFLRTYSSTVTNTSSPSSPAPFGSADRYVHQWHLQRSHVRPKAQQNWDSPAPTSMKCCWIDMTMVSLGRVSLEMVNYNRGNKIWLGWLNGMQMEWKWLQWLTQVGWCPYIKPSTCQGQV